MQTKSEQTNNQRSFANANEAEELQKEELGLSRTPPPLEFAPPQIIQPKRSDVIQKNDIASGYRIIRDQGLGASLREIWDYLTEDDIDDAQDVIDNMDTGLDGVSTAISAAIMMSSDQTRIARLRRFKGAIDRMQGYTSRALQAGEVYNNLRTFRDLLEGIEDMPDNITDDPEAAADAFGRITSSLGTLGGLLPDGPWSGYFEFLSGSRDFFTNMYRQVNVDAITEDRFRRQGLDPNDPGGTYRSRR
ncbi:MAG: hypothetical protein AAFO07_27950 [Bacteroidota bacterium]